VTDAPRRLLLISGERVAGRAQARRLLRQNAAERGAVWITEQPLAGYSCLTFRQAESLLGRDCELLVYDAWSGFDPDLFGLLGGTLLAGGWLVLLTPSLADWPAYADPQLQRLSVHPVAERHVGGRYLRRLARLLRQAPANELLHIPADQNRADLPRWRGCRAGSRSLGLAGDACVNAEQRQAVAAVLRVARGHRRRPLMLTAGRGRGKSSALGIAAARLLSEPRRRLLVSAPRRHSLQSFFARLEELLPQGRSEAAAFVLGDSRVSFLAPDELLRQRPTADLLLVDEAAGIPLPLLQQMLEHYARAVFCSTVHGYEGSGRGFALRFPKTLQRLAPGWHRLVLRQPVRWDEDDPLERLVDRMLMLQADAPVRAGDALVPTGAEPIVGESDRDALVADEEWLAALFGLLVQAHYQTSPLDLRHLLDGPNIRIWQASCRGRPVAALLGASEGGFVDAELTAIHGNLRRYPGHLAAQSYSQHLGFEAAPRLRFLRVIRLAVEPGLQRRGLGSRLLREVSRQVADEGYDLLSSSFGLTADLLPFWLASGLEAHALGEQRDAASGAHALLMSRPLSRAGADLCDAARRRFLEDFPLQLGETFAQLEEDLALALLAGAPAPPLTADAAHQLRAFACQRRGYGDSLAMLWRVAPRVLADDGLDGRCRRLLLAKVLQRRDWDDCARRFALSGRREVLAALRKLLAAHLGGCAPSPAE
jgi:tRNA(Met) cytidine acetyltransferase